MPPRVRRTGLDYGPQFPSLLVGNPIERADAFVFPLYVAQLNLFDKFARKRSWSPMPSRVQSLGDKSETSDGPKYPSIVNRTDHQLLFLPNDPFAGTLYLTCSIMVPPKTIIKSQASATFRSFFLTGSPLWPPEKQQDWVVRGPTSGNEPLAIKMRARKPDGVGRPSTANRPPPSQGKTWKPS